MIAHPFKKELLELPIITTKSENIGVRSRRRPSASCAPSSSDRKCHQEEEISVREMTTKIPSRSLVPAAAARRKRRVRRVTFSTVNVRSHPVEDGSDGVETCQLTLGWNILQETTHTIDDYEASASTVHVAGRPKQQLGRQNLPTRLPLEARRQRISAGWLDTDDEMTTRLESRQGQSSSNNQEETFVDGIDLSTLTVCTGASLSVDKSFDRWQVDRRGRSSHNCECAMTMTIPKRTMDQIE